MHSGSETGFVANPSITDLLFVLVSFKLRVLSPLLLAQIVVCESSLTKSTTDFAFASSHTLGKLSVLYTGNVGEGFPTDPSKLQCTSFEFVNYELVREGASSAAPAAAVGAAPSAAATGAPAPSLVGHTYKVARKIRPSQLSICGCS